MRPVLASPANRKRCNCLDHRRANGFANGRTQSESQMVVYLAAFFGESLVFLCIFAEFHQPAQDFIIVATSVKQN
jgi:hypothetical protein